MWRGKHIIWPLLILLFAAVLRFYRFGEIPFMHDEFSALYRTGFRDFSDLLQKGVIPDFHPAGIQVLLNYYVMISGWEEWLVKLPFAICGLASVYVIYTLGKEWKSAETAWISAAFMTVSQFFIFYSQLARPYIAGLLLILLAARYWYRIIRAEEKLRLRDYFLWILCAAAGAYTHYYLLLTLVLMSLIGLILCSRRFLPLYLISGIFIFLLFLPHLQIFIAQFSKGGVEGWLNKPQPDFILEFFRYFFHYNHWYLLAILILTALGIFYRTSLNRAFLIGILLFPMAYLAGYVYSSKVNAILQFSGLIFSFPFFLISISYFLSARRWLTYLSVFTILFAGSFTLIDQRRHYDVFYNSPYETFVSYASSDKAKTGGNTLKLIGGESHILEFYFPKHNVKAEDLFQIRELELDSIHLLIKKAAFNKKGDGELILGTFPHDPAELYAMCHYYFPHLKYEQHFYQGSLFHFTESTANLLPNLNAKHSLPGPVEFNTSTEFNAEIPWPEFFKNFQGGYQMLDIIAEVESPEPLEQVEIITAVYLGDSLIHWHSSPLGTHYTAAGETFPAFHSEEFNKKRFDKDARLKIFIWNLGKETFRIKNMQAFLRKGNPYQYGLYLPLELSD